jgi:hypothetical protein
VVVYTGTDNEETKPHVEGGRAGGGAWDGNSSFLIISIISRSENVLVKLMQVFNAFVE